MKWDDAFALGLIFVGIALALIGVIYRDSEVYAGIPYLYTLGVSIMLILYGAFRLVQSKG